MYHFHEFIYVAYMRLMSIVTPEGVAQIDGLAVSLPCESVTVFHSHIVKRILTLHLFEGHVLLSSFLIYYSQQYDNYDDGNNPQTIVDKYIQARMLILPRHVDYLEVIGKVVLGISMLLCHLPVHPIVLLVYSHWYVGGFCAVKYLCRHFRHVIGDGLGTGKISADKPAALCSEVKPCGGEHGFGAAHIHHHLRLLVVFHLHISHLGESAHGKHKVLVAKRVLLGVHVGVLLQVVEREGSDRVYLGRKVEYLEKRTLPSDIIHDVFPSGYLLLYPLLAHLIEIMRG